jgi:hypothetical protein
LSSHIPLDTWILYDPVDRGPGISSQQVFFNATFTRPPSIVINSCFDQYKIDTFDALYQIIDLAYRMEMENALYATGSRDVPVLLATHKRNSDLRIIHELFHSLAIGSDRLRVPYVPKGVTPAYAAIGESTAGLDCVNTAHQAFSGYAAAMAFANGNADMSGFATNYYMTIKASQLAPTSAGYVQAYVNKFYGKRDEKEELSGVLRLIATQSSALAKTDIAPMLYDSCARDASVDRIAEFYPRDDVLQVQDILLKALRPE